MMEIRGDIETAKGTQQVLSSEYPESEMLAKRLEWFQDLKLGVIMHWGLYAEAGIVESWQLSEKDEWAREPVPFREDIKVLQRDYWELITEFNPTQFNPAQWAKDCREAGFKYLILTTKHHDGFNLFDTQFSDYKITSPRSPFSTHPKRNLVKEVFDAFRQEGLAVGVYYSKADWHHPCYWLPDETKKGRHVSYDTQANPEIWLEYVNFVHNQLEELMTDYGKIDLLWLDAGWCGQGQEDLQMDTLIEKLREKQPELIVVDRMMGGRHENYVTPERKIPTKDQLPSKAWESNIPLGNDWGYVPTDTFKQPKEVLETVIDVVSKGGNLILGVGPKPDGTLTKEEKEIMRYLGQWLLINQEAIYKTRPVFPIQEKTDWKLTQNDSFIYLIYTGEPKSQSTVLDLNDVFITQSISRGFILSQKEVLSAELSQANNLISIPKEFFQTLYPVLALEKA